LQVAHERLEYIKITEKVSLDVWSWIGIIGGIIGLYCGCSFLTVVQVLMTTCGLSCHQLINKSKRSIVAPSSNLLATKRVSIV
jgi:hypothetical protein